jgi:hypothetical protein
MSEHAVPPPEPEDAPITLERRAHVSYSCGQEAFFQPAPQPLSDLWWQADVRNISLGGVALATRRRFEPGAILDIELAGPDGEPVRTLLARVVRVREQEDGLWLIGCRFIGRLGEEEFQALLPAAPRPSEPADPNDLGRRNEHAGRAGEERGA